MMADVNRNKEVLKVLVYDTRNDKQGILKIVWPPLFRGLEEPNEFYPSVAGVKLVDKFYKAHPQPFRELKEVYKLGILPGVMDFLESPLEGRLEGLFGKEEVEIARKLEYCRERMDHFVFHPFAESGVELSAKDRSDELEYYLETQKAYDARAEELTKKYRGWLAKQCGEGTKSGSEPNSVPAPPLDRYLDCLRRDEIITFPQFSWGYGTEKGFDMDKANREAFLSLYEQSSDNSKGCYVLIAYGRKIISAGTLEEVSAVADRLKLFESECLKAKLDRETFVGLAK